MNYKTYSIWCSKQGLNPYLKSSQDKWEKYARRRKIIKGAEDFAIRFEKVMKDLTK